MHVSRDSGTIVLTPSNDGEDAILREIMATVKPGETLEYGGREGANPGDPIDQRMTIKFKFNDKMFNLLATDDTDEKPIRYTRNAVFFGGAGLIFLGFSETAGVPKLEFAINRCKHCDKAVISMHECESRVCDACAEKCEHEYVRGMGHGGDLDIMGMGEFCTKCRRGKPKPQGERKKSQIERELEVQNELGVIVQYKNMPFGVGPKEVAQVQRLVRRFKRSRTRAKRA